MDDFWLHFPLTKQPGFLTNQKTGLVYIQIYAIYRSCKNAWSDSLLLIIYFF
ncbi:hypothetical protein SAMN05428975_4245 [Mucilaginibacter sp. OK268]|nr:hypothetical protein SAMN05428975_4245 [Mucilaginibacter sp. OK268]